MSEYLYFIFQIHNPKSTLIREFKNIIQCEEETLIYELTTLNRKLHQSSIPNIEKLKLSNDSTFDYLFRPNFGTDKHKHFFEARRMTVDCT